MSLKKGGETVLFICEGEKYELNSMTFDGFGTGLDNIPDESISNHSFEAERKYIVEEAKLSCMKAMLLCLDRSFFICNLVYVRLYN